MSACINMHSHKYVHKNEKWIFSEMKGMVVHHEGFCMDYP